MSISEELLSAYKATNFEVYSGEDKFVLKVDAPNREFDSLLAQNNAKSAVVITAWNPWSEQKTPDDNEANQSKMESGLVDEGFQLLPAAGVDPAGQWPAEASCCVLGMDLEQGKRRGIQFRQNAIVYHQKGLPTELVLTI